MLDVFTRKIEHVSGVQKFEFERVYIDILRETCYVIHVSIHEKVYYFLMRYDVNELQLVIEGPAPYIAKDLEFALSREIQWEDFYS